MNNNFFNVDAFLKADTKTQAEIIGFAGKAMHYLKVNEAVKSGEYRYWRNAMSISENICGDQFFYLKRFYKQVDNMVRKGSGIISVPATGKEKRELFSEFLRFAGELLQLRRA